MDTKLIIGYAGTLNGYNPKAHADKFAFVKDWIWTYKVSNLDTSTRSGYYLFQAVRYLKDNHPEYYNQLRIELWGNIAPVHLKQVKLLELEQAIHISSYLNKDKSIIKLNNCDVMFLPLESSKNGQQPLFIPGKLFDYLKIGKPVLTLSEPCDSSEILIEAGIGIQIDPKATDLVAQQLILLINRKNELNKIYRPNLKFIRQFDSKSLTQKLTNLLDEL